MLTQKQVLGIQLVLLVVAIFLHWWAFALGGAGMMLWQSISSHPPRHDQ